MDIIFEKESYLIQGACLEVYKELGNGFLENVYQESLSKEFKIRKIDFFEQKELNVFYKGEQLNQFYKADFICYDKIIVKIKTVSCISSEHVAQILNYLKITNMKLGILVNFGHYPNVEIKRYVL